MLKIYKSAKDELKGIDWESVKVKDIYKILRIKDEMKTEIDIGEPKEKD